VYAVRPYTLNYEPQILTPRSAIADAPHGTVRYAETDAVVLVGRGRGLKV
jgi:hypothetical protein